MIDKTTFNYWQSTLDEIWMDTMKMVHPGKDHLQAAKEAFAHLMATEQLDTAEPGDFKRLMNGWLSNKRFPKPTFKKVLHQIK